MEHKTIHRSKVQLLGFDWRSEIDLRQTISQLTVLDIEVLEEILFSPLKVLPEKILLAVGAKGNLSLDKFTTLGLCHKEGDYLLVDKEKRRYFEFQIGRFDPTVKPDMEFLQGLLRLFPIHLLPSWYAIPRTSNHIFSSIVEKYLLTPQIYQRYLDDLACEEPLYDGILDALFHSPDLSLPASYLIEKYHLTQEKFEELLIQLELHFACCLTYRKKEGTFQGVVTPFYEWESYLRYLRKTATPPLSHVVRKYAHSDFPFIEEMSALASAATKQPIEIPEQKEKAAEILLKASLAELHGNSLKALPSAADWLSLGVEQKALALCRTPLFDLRDAEKIIKRALHGEWLSVDDYLLGVLPNATLVGTGKHWEYALSPYSELEKTLQRTCLTESLFYVGVVALGTYQGRDCFSVTPFGRLLFEG